MIKPRLPPCGSGTGSPRLRAWWGRSARISARKRAAPARDATRSNTVCETRSHPPTQLPRDVRSNIDRKSATLSVGIPLWHFPVAYRRAYGLFTSGLFANNLRSPLCGNLLIESNSWNMLNEYLEHFRSTLPASRTRVHVMLAKVHTKVNFCLGVNFCQHRVYPCT